MEAAGAFVCQGRAWFTMESGFSGYRSLRRKERSLREAPCNCRYPLYPSKKKGGTTPTRSTGKEVTAPKSQSGPKRKFATRESLPLPIPQGEGQQVNSGETHKEGDGITKDNDDVLRLTDVTKAETSAPGEMYSPVGNTLRAQLEPPRTLETISPNHRLSWYLKGGIPVALTRAKRYLVSSIRRHMSRSDHRRYQLSEIHSW